MQAMMSDRSARESWERHRVLYGWPGDDERKTLDEARRVLAVAEPRRSFHAYYGPAALRLCGVPHWAPVLEPTRQAAVALAESLAAFCAADDAAAFLRARVL